MAEEKKINPIGETTPEAIDLTRKLIEDAQFAALGVLEPQTGIPLVSRVGVAIEADGSPFMLVSDLSGHSKALAEDGRASLLFGEPQGRGDPLVHPRVTIIGQMRKLSRDDQNHEARREFWLKKHPKAKLYIDFGDFHFWQMKVERANLNGGFGKAFVLTAKEIVRDMQS